MMRICRKAEATCSAPTMRNNFRGQKMRKTLNLLKVAREDPLRSPRDQPVKIVKTELLPTTWDQGQMLCLEARRRPESPSQKEEGQDQGQRKGQKVEEAKEEANLHPEVTAAANWDLEVKSLSPVAVGVFQPTLCKKKFFECISEEVSECE